MAVDKIELLKRYKELKAQGVSISLMELKKQMEEGVKNVNDSRLYNSDNSAPQVGVNDANASRLYNSDSSAPQGGVNDANASNFYNTGNSAPQGGVNETNGSNFYYTGNSTPQVGVNEANSYGSFVQNNHVSADSCSQNQQATFINQAEPVVQSPSAIQKYALIGYPLGHSLSGYIHNAGFKSLGMGAVYEILETSPDSLVDRIKFLKSNNYAGFNVTIPLKLPVTLFLDDVDTSADVVGAVNTVVINPDRTMKGYNTDVLGFRNAIPEDVVLVGKTAGVLGTGGAARAAITALVQSQVKEIKIYTRNIPNSMELVNYLRNKFRNVEFNVYQIERIRDLSDVQILVNTTPIGMLGRAADLTPVEENELRTLPGGAVVYDVIYNPKKTVLLKLAEKNGYRTINGVDMLIHQALASEQIWTGRTPDFKDMKIAALENL